MDGADDEKDCHGQDQRELQLQVAPVGIRQLYESLVKEFLLESFPLQSKHSLLLQPLVIFGELKVTGIRV